MTLLDLKFVETGWDDYLHWQLVDKKMVKKVNELIKSARRDPFEGIGKPEPLKFQLEGVWSRRITGEHRFVYLPEDGCITVIACRHHY
nr:Txe/YoeB family addiction module toxin [Rhodococcus sp. (in: high G+C Gram-positive bacteria)]